ncbi:urea ABC transporter permease subunit UrtB [Thaumasiovibrio sp. DFM-14]|uniref:urea ABC transporter permease subunit UrtB n=1 Tax=Thaumasiovibrio sp. DFM-14 TaxID=3384792 RepID=UPI00399FCD77
MKVIFKMLSAVALFCACINFAWASINNESSFTDALLGKKTPLKLEAIDWLVHDSESERVEPLLSAWLNGSLYYLSDNSSKQHSELFVIENNKTDKEALSAWSGETLLINNIKSFKKVRVNNNLRRVIRNEIATLGITSKDKATRYDAIQTLLGTSDPELLTALEAQKEVEKESDIYALIELTLAAGVALDTDASSQARITAVQALGEYKQSTVLKTLNNLLSNEKDPAIIAAAERSLDSYQQSQTFYSSIETLFFGLSLGSVLVLAGIGLAITFGVMGVINMAHGELIMIGAYTTYVMQQLMPNHIGLSLLLSIPMAFVVAGLVGVAIERSVIRHLYGRPLETLLATFGISLILQQAVRSIFSPLNRSVSTPSWLSGALEINPMLSLTYSRLYILLFCVLVFIGLLMVLSKTPIGLQVRAVSQNRSMARAMGIRSERVDAMTFGLGSGVAGIAGVALSQLTNVGPNMGQAYIIDSFMVVVFGGVGNLWGTFVAGMSLGLFNKFLEPWAGAVLAKILVLVFIILFIQKRPRGLFPQRGRAAEG